MLETELKAMLTKAQYEELKESFKWTSVKKQTNSYYIAPDNILKKHGIIKTQEIYNRKEHILYENDHCYRAG